MAKKYRAPSALTLAAIKARELGLTYGQYMAKVNDERIKKQLEKEDKRHEGNSRA